VWCCCRFGCLPSSLDPAAAAAAAAAAAGSHGNSNAWNASRQKIGRDIPCDDEGDMTGLLKLRLFVEEEGWPDIER
jgi:hypothetical protein